ncbi:MAG: type II toxin-antitoxin system VapC family toxin [Ignavibacteriales bacterium]|nr:type II toxin-antitoxin system VapC family toxin [Ignavibacteriales bacterium]
MKKIKRYVLDSYALICYLEGEKNADIVADVLRKGIDNEAEIFLCVINWGELYYIFLREQGKEAADLFLNTLNRYPITIVEANKNLTIEAAEIKAFNKLSFADAFAAALAKNKQAALVTGDKEFKQLENKIKIVWL